MSRTPHASWAEVYDLAYERSFGPLYTRLTDLTLRVISELCASPSHIIDFGAGTGRLAIPLAQEGHEVVAVDPCEAMLEQLRKKSNGVEIVTECCSMSEFRSSKPADLALGVFTVLLYIKEEQELLESLSAVRRALKDGGRMLVDVATSTLFQGFEMNDDLLTRKVAIESCGADRYLYRESLELKNPDGGVTRYDDEFVIRRWAANEVLEIAKAADFVIERDLSAAFTGSGSQYFLLQAV
jgi:SAM-dependent methyltransferase